MYLKVLLNFLATEMSVRIKFFINSNSKKIENDRQSEVHNGTIQIPLRASGWNLDNAHVQKRACFNQWHFPMLVY